MPQTKDMMKKISSAILALAITVGSLSTTAFAASDAFHDVPSNAWYEAAVSYCAEHSYMNGEGDGVFNPSGTVSRAQVAQVLYNLEGNPGTTFQTTFTDVDRNAWYGDAVAWAQQNGVVNGVNETSFQPESPVTREQVATMFSNFARYKGEDMTERYNLSRYADQAMISTWAKKPVSWAVATGLMSGVNETELDPQDTCIRAQLAQFIKNFFEGEPASDLAGQFITSTPTNEEWSVDILTPGSVYEKDGKTWVQLPETNIGSKLDPVFAPNDWDIQPAPADGETVTDEYGRITELGYIPHNGYVKNGRIYNRLGFDVTSVDGTASDAEMEVFEKVNEYRREAGVPDLKWSAMGQAIADERAITCHYNWRIAEKVVFEADNIPEALRSDTYAHNVWDGPSLTDGSQGKLISCFESMNDNHLGHFLGEEFAWGGECVYYHYTLEQLLESSADAWYDSEAHREFMLNPEYTKAAIGIYNNTIVIELSY